MTQSVIPHWIRDQKFSKLLFEPVENLPLLTMKINEDWHKKNRMPKNPKLAQRVEWYKAHAKNCGCRPIPEKLQSYIKK